MAAATPSNPRDPQRRRAFAQALRGYDRTEVEDYLDRRDAEIRVLMADRDAASRQASELTARLADAQREIERLSSEVDKLAVPPTTAEGMSDRISRIMRLATDEASEIQAAAEAHAKEVRSIAEQQADQLLAEARAEAEALRAEADEYVATERKALAAEREQHAADHAASLADVDERRRLLGVEAEESRNRAESEYTKTTLTAQRDADAYRESVTAELDAHRAQSRDELADLLEYRSSIVTHLSEVAERLGRLREFAASDGAVSGVTGEVSGTDTAGGRDNRDGQNVRHISEVSVSDDTDRLPRVTLDEGHDVPAR